MSEEVTISRSVPFVRVKTTPHSIYLLPSRTRSGAPVVDFRKILPHSLLRYNVSNGNASIPRTPHVAAFVKDALRDINTIYDRQFESLIEARGRLDQIQRIKCDPEVEPNLPPSKSPRWFHQIRGLGFILELYRNKFPGAGLFSGMGTGKTKVAVDLIDALEYDLILVIGPKNAVRVWHREVRKHAQRPYQVVRPDLTVSIEERTVRAARRVHSSSISVIVFATYDMVWREPFASWALEQSWDMVICDEIHRIKSATGQASRFIATLGQRAIRRLGLTGTPLHHSPLDIWAQYRFLDPGIFPMNFLEFSKRYRPLVKHGEKHPELERELHERIYQIAYRVTEDVLQLPETQHETVIGDLSPRALRVYHQLEKELIVDIGTRRVTANNGFTRLMRLQQVTSGFVNDDDGKMHLLSNDKEELLYDLLLDIGQEPVVVYAVFLHDLDRIKAVAKRLGVAYGEVSGRTNDVDLWFEGKVNLLGVQIRSGAESEDFTRSRFVVYYSTGFSLGDYEQSLRRVSRPGQTRNVTYYHLVMRGTIDERKIRFLHERKDLVESILADLATNPTLPDDEVLAS